MQPRFLRSLIKPAAYPEPTSEVRLIQTHISFLFITDSYVYKVKKPVDFGFLNFSTIDRRRFYCEEEVRLNRRLCPDVYLGVVEVRESPNGASFNGQGRTIDYAVKMKRLPEERMLDRLVERDAVNEEQMREIARVVGRFHLEAETSAEIARYGGLDVIRGNWDENFRQTAEFVHVTLAPRDLHIIRTWVDSFMKEHEALFRERVSSGFIRDCDGDLHLENICLADKICIFDCIEFSNRFRYSDTAADIAFFLMDLDFHGRRDLAQSFLKEYVAFTGDGGMEEILDFYKTYRAVVRGKVESFRLNDLDIPEQEKREAMKRAKRHFRLARGYVVRRSLPPTLILTCGLTGSGKSTLAEGLTFELGLETADSDRTRKELAGLSPFEHCADGYGEGIYTPEATRAVYDALFDRAAAALAKGDSIIIDATFRNHADRERFRLLAEKYGARFRLFHTACSDGTAKRRLARRASEDRGASDGRWEVYLRQKKEFEPVDSAIEDGISIDTSGSPEQIVDRALVFLGVLR